MENDYINFLNRIKIKIDEANFVRVWPFWEDIVSYYHHNRIYLITDGTATLYLKNRTVQLEPKKLYFIPSNSVVRGKCNILGHYFCHFQIEQSFEQIENFINLNYCVDADQFDIDLFKRLINNYPYNTPQQLFEATGSFRLLFSRFMDKAQTVDTNAVRFVNVLEYINNNLSSTITLSDIAAQSELNTNYFCSLFKSTFHISPWQYLIDQRLNKAVSILVSTNTSIKNIAYSLGFIDEFYFSRAFKKKFGISPRKYKNNYIEANRRYGLNYQNITENNFIEKH